MGETTHRALRLALASLLAVALAAQYIIGWTDADLTVVDFFSYFTVLSNTGAVVMLTMLAAEPDRDRSLVFGTFRGAVTVYMAVTALLYAAVLYPQQVDVAVPEPWIDLSIHVLGPILVVADWVHDRPPVALPARTIGIWVLFPAIYLGYSLIRGPLADRYPYPFLNPATGGYDAVLFWSLVVLAVILALSYAFYWWCNRRQTQPAAR